MYKIYIMVYLTRVEKFNAAHRLYVPGWGDEENKRVFGKCANPNWHGHNYYLHVTIKGDADPITGFIMDAKALGKVIKERIIDKLDHMNLNLDVDFIPENIQPTSENLVKLIWHELKPYLDGYTLHRIKLIETDSIYVEYFGE
jgi:6-pyruvoyltetrahydropterin/6-carboxytetrahydropterin synthase